MGYQCEQQNKSAVIHFRQPTFPAQTGANFTLGEMQIPIVNRYTYLGIIYSIDEFTTYQDAVQAKIEKATGAFSYTMVAQLRQIGGTSHRVYRRLFDSMIALCYRLWGTCARGRDSQAKEI